MLPLFAQGCGGLPVEVDSPLGLGYLASRQGRVGVVIGAPHGTSDPYTDQVSVDLAQWTGFGLVIATGYEDLDARRRRLNVNRPTEGVPGGPPAEEVWTRQAREVYEAYVGRVKKVAQGRLSFYIEVHGNGRRGNVGRIELATVGVSQDDASKLRTRLELIRDCHLRGNSEIPHLDVLVEPVDRVSLTASVAKQIGILKLPAQAIHIELPRVARTLGRETYTRVLGEFLTEAARFLGGQER